MRLVPSATYRLFTGLVALAVLGACSKTEGPTDVDAVASVTVSPTTATLSTAGATTQLSASALRADGSSISGTSFTWSSSDTNVATVSASGLVTAVANGTATVSATASSRSGSATITVSIPVTAGQVTVTPDTATLTAVAQTVQLSVSVLDTGGSPIASPAGSWTSSAPGVATVSNGGLVTAVADGTTSVFYSVDGVADTAQITVTTGPPPAALFTVEHDAGWLTEDVWGAAANDMWAVGYNGAIMHNDGSGWDNVTPGITDARLTAIWGASANDVWAAGQFGEILHYDGSSWSTTTSPTSNWILEVDGVSATDAWGVGISGTAVHWDGTSWTTVATPTSGTLNGVHAVSANDVWAAGDGGTILHWDGTSWTSVSHGATSADLEDILVLAANDIWVAGPGYLVHYDGSTWSIAVGSVPVFTELWSPGPGEAWGVSAGAQFTPGDIYYYDGSTWSDVTPAGNVIGRFNGMHGTSSSDVWAVGLTTGGGSGIAAWHWDGSTWTEENGGLVPMSIAGSWGSGPNDVWAVTDRLGILHYDGTQWTDESLALDAGQIFFNVWGAAANDVWAVGGSSSHIYHYDGAAWSNVTPSGTITGAYGVHDIWGSASNDVWAVQPLGRIIHWDGSTWARDLHGLTSAPLYAVWGSGPDDVYAAGGSSTVVMLHWDGTQWTDVSPAFSGGITEMWGSGPNDVYAVGFGGVDMIHFDGTTWSSVTTPFVPSSVEGSSANDVWITGAAGGIAFWDGTQWTDLSLSIAPARSLNHVWLEPGVNDGTIWAFGAAGLIVKGTR